MMNQEIALHKIQLVVSILMFVSLLFSNVSGSADSPGEAKPTLEDSIFTDTRADIQDICMMDGTVEISSEGREAVMQALADAGAEVDFQNAECFAPIDLRDEGEWAIVTLIGVKGVQPGLEWSAAEHGVWSDLALLHFSESSVSAAIAGTQDFSQLLDRVPEATISRDAKNALDPLVPNSPPAQSDVSGYRFPFQLGTQVNYFRFHTNTTENFTFWTGASSKAVDLGSDGNTGLNHAPNQLYAVASGYVRLRCSQEGSYSSTYLAVENDDGTRVIYAHLNKSGAPALGSRITHGQALGALKTGSFSDGVCGHATQGTSSFHVHFEVPNMSSLTLSDWTLNTSTGVWTKGSETWTAGQYKVVGSTTTGTGCGEVSYNGVIFYEHKNCNQENANARRKEFSSATGWTDIVSDFNDIASSIHVQPGWSVKVFEKSVGEGGGSWRCMTGSMWDLNIDYYTNGDTGRRINDDISSVQVYSNSNNCGSGGGGVSATWNARFFNGHDHWWDNNNFNNQMCEKPITSTGLDENYGSNAPCNNGVGDHWVAEYNATVNFAPGNYVFQAQNDDGLKMWVNGTNILERGGSQGLSYICPVRYLSGNVPIRAILNEEGGDARVKIAWTTDTSICNLPGSFNKAGPSNGSAGQSTNPTLSWNSSSGANNYSYCIDTSNNNSCDTGWIGVGNVTSKALSGLSAGTTYYWHVRAHSEGGETYSNNGSGDFWSFTTQGLMPSVPGNLGFSSSSPNSITIHWDDVGSESGYRIYEWNGASFVYLDSVGANVTSYTETRAQCGWDEFYTVSAYNAHGESEQSGWVQGFTLECPAGLSKALYNFDGDNDSDIAIYRRSQGYWYIKDQFFTKYGIAGDIPVPADYDGDGDTDIAIYRPSQGFWYIKDQFFTKYGIAGDVPMPADYDGDGDTDLAIFRRSQGFWYIKDQFFTKYGIAGDIPIPGDYDGDGDTDIAIFRPSQGMWYVRDQFFTKYGIAGDIPVPADYDGDGDTDIAIYRPSQGMWYIKDQYSTNYGIAGDVPVPADYDGDGDTDVAIYRPSQGMWYVKDQFSTRYGIAGDIPIPVRDTNGDGDPYQ